MKLSVIIPIKVTFQNRFLLNRIQELIQYFSNFNDIEVVVVDSSPKTKYSKSIEYAHRKEWIHYYFLEMPDIYSAAKARNYGAKKAKGEYLLFYDADLVAHGDFIENVLQDIARFPMKKAFNIYPCLYLSESKTKIIEGKKLGRRVFEEIKVRYLEGYNDDVLYLAVNTSTILVNTEHFFSIGAYDEVFKGHGYEDFELIHRLYMAYPIIPRNDDYAIDHKTPFPKKYKGFRKYFAYYALPNFFKDNYTLHLWHPRPLTKKYYRHREVNSKYFIQYLKESLVQKMGQQHFIESFSDYNEFVDNLLISNGYDDKKYCGLESLNAYAEAQKKKSNLSRRMRRRILNLMENLDGLKKGKHDD